VSEFMKKSCKKKKRKNSLKKIFKGFTLVELLAVIVILAIIMIIAIPAVLDTMESARRKTFAEYVDKVSTLSQKQLAEDQMLGNKSLGECIVYNVKTGLELNNTGNYEGWVLINPSKNDIYVTLYDDNYVIVGYHYSDSSLKIDDYIQKKTSDNESKLTVEELCRSSSCTTCNIDDTIIDKADLESGLYVFTSKNIKIGSPIPEGVNVRNNLDDAMKDWLNYPGRLNPVMRYVCLELKLENNLINEGYVKFKVTKERAETNPGMKAGTYTLRGGINESSLENRPIYEANKKVLLEAFGSSYCTEEARDGAIACRAKDWYAHAESDGWVVASDDGDMCHVSSDYSLGCG